MIETKPSTREVVRQVISGLIFRWGIHSSDDSVDAGTFWRQWVGAHVYYYSCALLADMDGHVVAAYPPARLLLVEYDEDRHEWVPADQITVIMQKAPKK